MAVKARRPGARAAEARPKWRRRAAERPGEIVAAAAALFAERGFERTRMEDVAARAGVTKATVYLYFADKERLFEAVVREAMAPNLDRIEAFVADHDGSAAAMVRMIATMLEGVLESGFPALAKMIVAESSAFPALAKLYVDLVMSRGFRLVESQLRRGIDRGEFRAVDTRATTPLFVAPFLMLGLWRHAFGRTSDLMPPAREVIAAHVDVLLRGLAPDAAPAPRRPRVERRGRTR